MANIIKCRGFVLKTFPFKESSLVASVLSDRLGKIKLMVKGVRRPKSRICGAMEPFNLDEIIFYKREFKEMYNLSDAVIIEDFEEIRKSPRKVNAAFVLCEFYEKTLPAEEVEGASFTLLLGFLRRLCRADESAIRSLVVSHLLRALVDAGVMPHLNDCVRCHGAISGNSKKVNFSVALGGVVCSKHHDDSVMLLSPETVDVIKDIYTRRTMSVDPQSLEEIESILTDYMSMHLNDLDLNSLRHLR
jgi:DNA repair protein RecO (recombination protein O)